VAEVVPIHQGQVSTIPKYEEACRAIAAAKGTDELKQIRNVSDALRAAARIAKNKKSEIDWAEVRLRAERRIGEMMELGREDRAPEGRRSKNNGVLNTPLKPTLTQVGIDKNLAKRARRLASPSAEEFELQVKDWRGDAEKGNSRATLKLANKRFSKATTRKLNADRVRKHSHRAKAFLDATKMYKTEVSNARTDIAKFSPEGRRFVVSRINGLMSELIAFKKELES
jgi:hypothetical protein